MIWISFYIAYEIVGWGIRLAMVPIVLRRQMAPGASVAWLGIVALHPYIGLALYLLVGESRLGPRRAEKHRQIMARFRDARRQIEGDRHQTTVAEQAEYQPMIRVAQKISGLPILSNNHVEFFNLPGKFVDRLVADISVATRQVHLLYYIFANDDVGRRVVDALIAATRRGVKCRVLVDGMASRRFLRNSGLSSQLRAAGVEVAAALPVDPIRRELARMDMRNHRKLSVIDDSIAYIGSNNLINPDYGGRRGNPWIDVVARLSGPVVGELATVFAEDWAFETGEELDPCGQNGPDDASENNDVNDVAAQVVPTGPSVPGDTYRRVLLEAIQSSRTELILTTPYFVPDEPTLLALMMACDRGVTVKLIVPKISDSIFAAMAGRAHYQALMQAGVEIYLYRPGLIHAKSSTIDGAFGVFGSANLDVRSFHLNFELTMLFYGKPITERLKSIQLQFLNDSERINAEEWSRRPVLNQYAERAVALLSPLL